MKKQILALVLACLMLVGILGACNKEGDAGDYVGTDHVENDYELVSVEGYQHQFKKYKDMTTENITLRYFHFDQDETVKELARVFMAIYPNITVEVAYYPVADYNTTLNSLITSRNVPDVIMFSDADYALTNKLPMDISSYWNSDEETQNLADTINDAGLGCFGLKGGQRYAVPVKFFPQALYVDRNVLKTLNLPIPDQNWTWSEMINIIKNGTVLNSSDGMAYYGLGGNTRLDSYYGIAAGQQYVGEFGFNGERFDLSAWAVGEQEYSDLKLSGVVAPNSETQEMEDWMGDWEGWCGASGHVALFVEPFWTFQNIWNSRTSDGTYYMDEYNLDIVPYVVPAVSEADAGADHHSIATIDFGGVTDGCPYPREAYELLKFMSFGVDGWYARCEIYSNPSMVNAAGNSLKYDVMPAPLTKDEGVWDAYIKMFCDGMDEEHTQFWRDYFASAMKPIPFGWTAIAGYWNYCDEYFNSIGIHDIVDQGRGKAADYVDEATKKANLYHAQAMLNYFGANGYNVLTDEEVELYNNMVTENS